MIDNAGQHDSLDYLGEIAGKKIFEQYTSANFETYGALKKEREGHNRESTIYSNENRGREKNTKKHNGFVNLKDKENAKTEKEFNDPNGRYSKDDTIFDDFADEEVMFTADGDIAFDGFGADAQRTIDVKELVQVQGAEHAVYTLYNAAALRQMAEMCSEAFENARENEREFGRKESGERYDKTANNIADSEDRKNAKK